MGRPYDAEMAHLPMTYAAALAADPTPFAHALRAAGPRPLIAIGSGGSLTAAHFAADLHQYHNGQVARVMTPYDVVAHGGVPRDAAVVLFSAGGRNADIRAAFEACVHAEPAALIVITATPDSPLGQRTAASGNAVLVACPSSAGRDGFLATNSLLTFVVLTARAHAAANQQEADLPLTLASLLGDLPLPSAAELGGTRVAVTLHGRASRAAAVDLESKCTEAALAVVQLADYRNFAHGRHHWLAKHQATVVTVETPEDRRLVERTVSLLPPTQPVIRIQCTHGGTVGAIEALVRVMQFAGSLGEAVGIDPGRPGVPEFGGKLYSLRTISAAAPRIDRTMSASERAAIERKARISIGHMQRTNVLHHWRAAYRSAGAALHDARIGGVVFDYDGTLVDAADRFTGPRPPVTQQLERLLQLGVPIGIATGRGRSAGNELRNRLPATMWERVLIGYYNGGDIASLMETTAPDGQPNAAPALRPVHELLASHALLTSWATLTPRRPQITIEPHDPARTADVWDLTATLLVEAFGTGIRMVRSSHSIDVLAPQVSKLLVLDALRRQFDIPDALAILRVGDRGQWPGNDAELLASPVAVSVDETTIEPTHAWRWSPAGTRGVQATIALCAQLQPPESDRQPAPAAQVCVRLTDHPRSDVQPAAVVDRDLRGSSSETRA